MLVEQPTYRYNGQIEGKGVTVFRQGHWGGRAEKVKPDPRRQRRMLERRRVAAVSKTAQTIPDDYLPLEEVA